MANLIQLTLSDGTIRTIVLDDFTISHDVSPYALDDYVENAQAQLADLFTSLLDEKCAAESARLASLKKNRVFSNFSKPLAKNEAVGEDQTTQAMSSVVSRNKLSSFGQVSRPKTITEVLNTLVQKGKATHSFGDIYILGDKRHAYTLTNTYWESPFGTNGQDAVSLEAELNTRVFV